MTTIQKLKELLPIHNEDKQGIDSTKRALAIEVLARPADGWQTDRLCNLAIAFLEAQQTGRPATK